MLLEADARAAAKAGRLQQPDRFKPTKQQGEHQRPRIQLPVALSAQLGAVYTTLFPTSAPRKAYPHEHRQQPHTPATPPTTPPTHQSPITASSSLAH